MKVLTVISWFAARKARRPLLELVQRHLTTRPTLIAIVSDQYTNEFNIRPFAPIADRLAGRLDVILAAEWKPEDRERDGEALFRGLGLAEEARPRLVTDEGDQRVALVVRQKEPIALIDLFFVERGRYEDAFEAELRQHEDAAVRKLEDLLGRLPPQPPPPPRALRPGEHDFNASGLCRQCAQGSATLLPCAGTNRDEGPKRDRFELIELE